MILLTDGGSTKCDWALLDENSNVILKTQTSGLNPNVVSKEDIRTHIVSNKELKNLFDKELTLDFYGAGCGAPKSRKIVEEVLEELFKKAQITVKEDTVVAVRAVTSEPGIVCILGTGSNSCYFDGHEIHHPIASLGCVLMDEASGNYFGKALINDFYYGRKPKELANEFESNFDVAQDSILLNLYKKE